MRLLIYAILCVLTVNVSFVFAQELDYEIEVFLSESAITRESGEIPAQVKITNNAKQPLRTNALYNIHFYFSKCPIGTRCTEAEDAFVADSRIPSKEVARFDSFEFEINLAGLSWKDANANPNSMDDLRPFSSMPAGNIYFYAAVKRLQGYRPGNGNAKLPVYKIVNSNMIGVTFG